MVKSIFSMFIMLVFFLYGSAAWSENLVQNGNFEAGSIGWKEWNSTQAWVNGETFEHDYAKGTTVWVPDPYPYEGSHTHSQHKGVNNIHGGLYQVINVTKGKTYTITGQWSGGVGGLNPALNENMAWFEVTIYDGVATPEQIDAAPGPNDVAIAKREYVYDVTSGNNVYFFGWETFSGTFKAQSSQVTLALKTGKVGDWDAIAAYHDDIVIYDFSWPMFVPPTTGSGTR